MPRARRALRGPAAAQGLALARRTRRPRAASATPESKGFLSKAVGFERSNNAGMSGKVELVCRWIHDPKLILEVTGDWPEDETTRELEQAPNEFTVHLVRCRGLARTNRSLACRNTSNPGVVVSTKSERRRTKPAKKTVAPVFQKRFSFEARVGDPDVTLEVFDFGEGGDDPPLFMGRAKIPLKDLQHREVSRRWLPLTDQKGKRDAPRGQVDVACWHRFSKKYVAPIPNDTEDDAVPHGGAEINQGGTPFLSRPAKYLRVAAPSRDLRQRKYSNTSKAVAPSLDLRQRKRSPRKNADAGSRGPVQPDLRLRLAGVVAAAARPQVERRHRRRVGSLRGRPLQQAGEGDAGRRGVGPPRLAPDLQIFGAPDPRRVLRRAAPA